jgi:hypothetical protein
VQKIKPEKIPFFDQWPMGRGNLVLTVDVYYIKKLRKLKRNSPTLNFVFNGVK